jgi:hypothetical protein
VRLLGYECEGKNLFPYNGEMTADVIRKAVYGKTFDTVEAARKTSCPGRLRSARAVPTGASSTSWASGRT